MKEIKPIKGVKTIVNAPPSKAHTLRALFIAALARGQSKIINPLLGEDQNYAIDALKQLGIKIFKKENYLEIEGLGGLFATPEKEIYLGNSGVSVRFLTTMASLCQGKVILTGNEAMQSTRPIGDLISALKKLGVNIRSVKNNNLLPIEIEGPSLQGGTTEIQGEKSSQYFSSIMISAPYAKDKVTIKTIGEMSSKPYIDITTSMMKDFGAEIKNKDHKEFTIEQKPYIGREYEIEGDFSNSSYFFAAAAIHGEITVKNIDSKSEQGDKFFLSCLQEMGCKVTYGEKEITVKGPEKLKNIIVDMNNFPDIVPTLAVVAAFAEGESQFTNIAHLRYKECDRLEAVATELQKMGIVTKTTEETLIVQGGQPKGATIDTYNDHRIAMSFSVAGLKIEGQKIKNPDCVKKSFPNFWEVFQKI